MQTTKCDSKGRIYLKEAVRCQYGERFVLVQAPGELVLIPVPEDPAEDLQQMGKALQGKSLKDLRERIMERAKKEVVY